MHELDKLYKPERDEKEQIFFDEIALIEQRIAKSDEHHYRYRPLKPWLYEPVGTVWKLLENESSETRNKIRELFKEEVIRSIEYSDQIASYLISNTEKIVQLQPDKRIELLTEDRDKYLLRLTNKYTVVDQWYYRYWNEDTQSVKYPGALEWDIFLYSQMFNKQFIVFSTILSDLYGHFRAVSRLNQLIQENSSQPKPINLPDNKDNTNDSHKDTDNEGLIKLSHPEIAILYRINGWSLNLNNATDIAKKYGHESGQRLMTEYLNLEDEEVRTGKSKNRIKNYINIKDLILPQYKSQYNKELESAIRSNKK